MHRTRALALLLPLLALAPARARGDDDPLAGLSGAAALAIAKDLAADAMKGRRTGFDGGRRAEDYVAQAMGEIGLDPKDPAGAYLDPFDLPLVRAQSPATLTLGGAPLAYGADVVDLLYSGGGEAVGEVVFAGHGLSVPGFDEYAGADLKGKVVLVLRGVPPSLGGAPAAERSLGARAAQARARGARALLVAEGEAAEGGSVEPRWFEAGFPVLALSRAAADRALAGAKTSLEAERRRRQPPAAALPALATGVEARLALAVERLPDAKGHNALGAIRGTDPDRRDEVVIVGAHMDHLGVDAAGRVYNGADDNASGTAVLLHLARTLVDAGWRPRRTILFLAFGAAEAGLLGSRHLADGLPFEHGGIVCVLNVDRVGQGGPGLTLWGGERFPEMGARLRAALPEALRSQLSPAGAPPPGGDHEPFAEKGVPAFLLATRGDQARVGTPDDDVERLRPESLEAAARALGALVVRLGEEPADLATPR